MLENVERLLACFLLAPVAVARAARATVYENWTDVSGFLKADPNYISNPKVINTITYKELRELSYMGATVLHEDAIFPVRYSKIPINIKNITHNISVIVVENI